MTETVTLNIPLKSYLKKYLQNKYGSVHIASRSSWLGAYVIDILDREYRKSNVTIKKEDFFPVAIPYSIVCDVGFSVSKAKLTRLEVMIRKVFYNDLYSYIEISRDNELKVYNEEHDSIIKQNALIAINQYLSFFDITEDELSADSVYRQYSRYKKDKKENALKEQPV
ncbi:hypothetical protein [Tenacibaculum singaporense]|uniref:hypothetical protein n=1 Tax=Tenacibaculum singaporense TaxID=2358479 RepID=UPI000F671382|nr:hypothetical protein [Tenacibaculum singaporense]RSC96045.1 hypothetical protein EI424_02690 [Tenacibaculum singaporense]